MGLSQEGHQAAVVTTGIDETKLRAAMMLSKVFLQHLASLSGLPTFSALWLSILDLIGQFSVTASDILADALPESLKNMLLVMDTNGGGLFFTEAGLPTPLWGVTWGKIDTFRPGLREELFPGWEKRAEQAASQQQGLPPTCPTNLEASVPVAVDPTNIPVEAPAQMQDSVPVNISEPAQIPYSFLSWI